ncbi:hypothetical protein Bpfe_004274 [Biomphalaria pfeifferi]|uniref:Uncharacterized protein n=1 Tax=Biomphalaria pfeifferi TaxID=112525 RepID=A0AAD8FJF7_BIOPF|nr:hypothetical protein Bpfe_004274 [Biomphalaria pfeifferi]
MGQKRKLRVYVKWKKKLVGLTKMATVKRESRGKCSFLDKNTRIANDWNTTYKDDFVYRYKSIKELSRLSTKEQEKKKPAEPRPSMGDHSQLPVTSTDLSGNDYGGRDASLLPYFEADTAKDSWLPVSETNKESHVLATKEDGNFQTIDQTRVVYYNELPIWKQPPLPGDILLPHPQALKTKDWKGVKIPFEDSRFEPLYLSDRDTDFMTCNLDPFRYSHRKKKFPEKSRCPYLPIPKEAYRKLDQLGNFTSVRHTTMPDRRLSKKRFPRPPESFLTRLW